MSETVIQRVWWKNLLINSVGLIQVCRLFFFFESHCSISKGKICGYCARLLSTVSGQSDERMHSQWQNYCLMLIPPIAKIPVTWVCYWSFWSHMLCGDRWVWNLESLLSGELSKFYCVTRSITLYTAGIFGWLFVRLINSSASDWMIGGHMPCLV